MVRRLLQVSKQIGRKRYTRITYYYIVHMYAYYIKMVKCFLIPGVNINPLTLHSSMIPKYACI